MLLVWLKRYETRGKTVASEVKIQAQLRSEFGKGAARRTRRAGLVPAVIYGHGQQPRHISIPGHDLMLALKNSNVLLELELADGNELVLPKSVVRDPIKGFLEHVDLIAVRRGEKVVVDVAVHTVGKHDPDGILETVNTSIQVRAEATSIPNELSLNIEGMAAGTNKTASDVELPAGTELVSPADMVVVHLVHRPTAAEAEAAITTTPAEEPAAPAAEAAAPAAE